ncbi:uncharacterized protein LOC106528281 isoform X3 [Austrofundulus limnaeus]|uniref:Uncharacterized protein LOC106528281 isoform X3 n=1 Tax=Austrofundulus limnaeus TaxID=52670 RepID=A0A2I4CFW2_AUSLI|nr:PREDICTED: sentrin-specific protease 5 isoform X3 [Austrofundulus limnaeus]
MYQTGNRCRKAASLQRWKKFMSSVKGASHLSRRAKRRLYFKLQFWFWRKRSEKHRLWLVRGQRGASGISSRLGLTLPSQKVEDLTNHLENRTVSERPAVPEPEERPDGGSGGAVQQNGRSGWSASDSSSETLCDSGCLQLTDSNFSSLVVGQTTQTALASLPSSERSVQLRETTSPLKLPHNVNPLPRADSNACDEQPEVLPADPLSQQHSHVFSYQDQMSTTTQCVDDRISSETTSPTNICLYELTTNIQDFLDGFYRRYGSFIPLCKEDLLGHLKRKFNSDLSDRRNQIISEVFRYQAAVIEKPIPSFQVVYKKHRLTLEDLLTLADQSWLNDQVMNMYGELIMESSHHKELLLDHIFDRLRNRLEHVLERMPLDLDFLEFICTQELVFLNALSCQVDVPPNILDAMAHLHRLINVQKQSEEQQTAVVHFEQGPAGRQRMVISSSDYLCSLLELHLPVPCIAKLLDISRRTVYRRMAVWSFSEGIIHHHVR